jgi:lysyl-tRNA synthetase class 2
MSPLEWRPSAALGVLRQRAAMLGRIRAYFVEQGVVEVDTPQLSAATVTDLHLEPVSAEVAGAGRMYLQTSPEYPMKRLLAAGIGDCFQICHAFRDGERGALHNPEFTLLEWYRTGFDAPALMDDVEALLAQALTGLRALPPAERVSYRQAVRELAGVDPMTATGGELAAALARRTIAVPEGAGQDRDALLDLLVATVVGPQLGRAAPTFLHDYPAAQAALARVRGGEFPVAERFELYLDGIELANGFHELADPSEQRRRFEADLADRSRRGQPPRPLDERFLASLASGLPDCAGVALGVDRLLMTALGLESLDAVIAFPVDRA